MAKRTKESIFEETRDPVRKEQGYVCDCPLGSPRPHYVVFVAMYHDQDCLMRKRINSSEYGTGGESL